MFRFAMIFLARDMNACEESCKTARVASSQIARIKNAGFGIIILLDP